MTEIAGQRGRTGLASGLQRNLGISTWEIGNYSVRELGRSRTVSGRISGRTTPQPSRIGPKVTAKRATRTPMNTREHEDRDDRKVWLSQDEVELLLETAEGPNQRIAFALGARCGLRSHETVAVTPEDIVETDAGPMLLVPEGKGDKYRECPIPSDLKNTIETAAEYRDEPDSHPIVTSQSPETGVSTRTIRRWTESAADELAEREDPRWSHLTYHDLRRTWATALKSADMDPLLVCDYGGWSDLETFLDAYRGTFSPDAQRRERDKVGWL